ncbi:MAG: glycosyltransferase [Calditrichaeota bacterium]|nr:MAG: glycosyltransferase [Calditrichota bacterium]
MRINLDLFSLVVFISSLIYFCILAWIRLGLNRLTAPGTDQTPFISVIVAARNEEAYISKLLTALLLQNYPRDRFEVIIIDDQSSDATASLVRSHKDERIHLIQTTDHDKVTSPKKHALHLGIENAKGEFIFLTDADCLPGKEWLHGMIRLFDQQIGMVIGFSPSELPKLVTMSDYLLALESLSLAAIAAGTTGWGFAATCNGRNLAYRKCVYKQVGGFSRIAQFISGDDDLFLKLVQQTEWKIRYAFDERLIVPTQRSSGFMHFVHQRLRHASKGFYYDQNKVIALIFVYFYNLAILSTLPLALITGHSPLVPLVAIGLKFIADFILLFGFASRMRRKKILWSFLPAELLHLPYVVLFGALGPFLNFKWKESK